MLTSLFVLALVCGILTFILTFKRSWTFNLIIWGVYLAVIFAPIFTVVYAFMYEKIFESGLAGRAFVLFEMIAILMVIVGCIGMIKKKKMKSDVQL